VAVCIYVNRVLKGRAKGWPAAFLKRYVEWERFGRALQSLDLPVPRRLRTPRSAALRALLLDSAHRMEKLPQILPKFVMASTSKTNANHGDLLSVPNDLFASGGVLYKEWSTTVNASNERVDAKTVLTCLMGASSHFASALLVSGTQERAAHYFVLRQTLGQDFMFVFVGQLFSSESAVGGPNRKASKGQLVVMEAPRLPGKY